MRNGISVPDGRAVSAYAILGSDSGTDRTTEKDKQDGHRRAQPAMSESISSLSVVFTVVYVTVLNKYLIRALSVRLGRTSCTSQGR